MPTMHQSTRWHYAFNQSQKGLVLMASLPASKKNNVLLTTRKRAFVLNHSFPFDSCCSVTPDVLRFRFSLFSPLTF